MPITDRASKVPALKPLTARLIAGRKLVAALQLLAWPQSFRAQQVGQKQREFPELLTAGFNVWPKMQWDQERAKWIERTLRPVFCSLYDSHTMKRSRKRKSLRVFLPNSQKSVDIPFCKPNGLLQIERTLVDCFAGNQANRPSKSDQTTHVFQR